MWVPDLSSHSERKFFYFRRSGSMITFPSQQTTNWQTTGKKATIAFMIMNMMKRRRLTMSVFTKFVEDKWFTPSCPKKNIWFGCLYLAKRTKHCASTHGEKLKPIVKNPKGISIDVCKTAADETGKDGPRNVTPGHSIC